MSEKYQQTAIRLLPSDRELLDRLAEAQGGASMGATVRQLIRDAGKQLRQPDTDLEKVTIARA